MALWERFILLTSSLSIPHTSSLRSGHNGSKLSPHSFSIRVATDFLDQNNSLEDVQYQPSTVIFSCMADWRRLVSPDAENLVNDYQAICEPGYRMRTLFLRDGSVLDRSPRPPPNFPIGTAKP